MACHLNAEWIAEECVCDPLDLGGHGGREEEGLAGERCQPKDAFDVRDETHVEHAISLIHNHDFDVGEDQFATLVVIQQAARCGDQHVDAFVDQLVLLLEGDTTDQQRFCQFQVLRIGVEILGDLSGQFTRGAKHQAARHTRTGAATGQHCDHRHGESGSFAGTSLGDTQNVTTFKSGRNGTCLNRCRGVVTHFFDSFKDLGVQV